MIDHGYGNLDDLVHRLRSEARKFSPTPLMSDPVSVMCEQAADRIEELATTVFEQRKKNAAMEDALFDIIKRGRSWSVPSWITRIASHGLKGRF